MSGTGSPSLLLAFWAGLVSFLSPCVLPLVPGYLSTVSRHPAGGDARRRRRGVLARSLLFVATFSAIFILLGLGATAVGSILQDHKDTLDKIAGVLIIAMGVLFIASVFVVRLNREWHAAGLIERAGTGRAARGGRGFRDRLDAVRRTDARRDPRMAATSSGTRSRRGPAGVLLAGPGAPVPVLRCRLRQRASAPSAGSSATTRRSRWSPERS